MLVKEQLGSKPDFTAEVRLSFAYLQIDLAARFTKAVEAEAEFEGTQRVKRQEVIIDFGQASSSSE